MWLLPRWDITSEPLFVLKLVLRWLMLQCIPFVFRKRFTPSVSFFFFSKKSTKNWILREKILCDGYITWNPNLVMPCTYLKALYGSPVPTEWNLMSMISGMGPPRGEPALPAAAALRKFPLTLETTRQISFRLWADESLRGFTGERIRADLHFQKLILHSLNRATISGKSIITQFPPSKTFILMRQAINQETKSKEKMSNKNVHIILP